MQIGNISSPALIDIFVNSILVNVHHHCINSNLFLFIFIGKCTSYVFSGNSIQENWRTDCTKFSMNACPTFYRSDEAYKCKFYPTELKAFMVTF